MGMIVGAVVGLAFSSTLIGAEIVTGLFGAILFGAAVGSLFEQPTMDFGASSPNYSFGPLSNTKSQLLPVPIVYGRVRMAGNIFLQKFYSDKREKMDMFVGLSHGPVNRIINVYANEHVLYGDGSATYTYWTLSGSEWAEVSYAEYLAFEGTKQIRDADGENVVTVDLQECSCDVHLGEATQPIDDREPGTENYAGIAYAAITLKVQEGLSGNPVITTEIEGRKVWTPAGERYTNNPIWCCIDLLTNEEYGVGLPIEAIDLTVAADSAAYCDQLVDGKPRYTLNYIIDRQRPATDILRDMLMCCDGYIREREQIQLCVNKPVSSPIMAIDTGTTAGDIIEGSFHSWGKSREEILNRVVVEWVDPENHYERTSYPFEDSADMLNRGVYERNISLLGVTCPYQAGRLGEKALRMSQDVREFCEFRVSVNNWDMEVGDVIAITDENNAWSGKWFHVLSMEDDSATEECTVICSEYQSSTYIDTPSVIPTTPDNPDPTDTLDDYSNLILTDVGTQQEDGTYIPKIRAQFSPPTTEMKEHVVNWWHEDESVSEKKVSPKVKDVLLSDGIQTGVLLTVRVWGTDINGKQRSGVIGQITPGKDSIAPGAPTSLTASSGFGEVILAWTNPETNEDGSPCADLAYIEIWECATDDRETAVLVGKVNGTLFTRHLGTFESRYYWVRAVDTSGNVSQWNAEAGVPGFADMENIEALFDWLMENDPLFQETYADLHENIEAVEALEVDFAESKVMLQENQNDLQESLTNAINQLAVGVGNLVQDSDETKSIFRDAEITVDPETGEVRIGAVELLRTETGTQFSEVSETLSAQEASINLKASRAYVDELATALISGVDAAEKWETLSAWTPANATISGTTFDPTGTGSTLTSPVIAVDGEENPIFSIHVQRIAGTGWGAKLQWKTSGHDYSASYERIITAPSGDLSTGVWIQLEMSEEADWVASEIIGLRILLGESAADEFVIDHISVGKSALQALILSGLETRVTQAEIDIDGVEAAIILKADQTTVNALGARMDQAEIDIDGAEAAIALKAAETDLTAAEARITDAEIRIDAVEGEISSEIIATLANTVAEGVAENILESEREIAALATAKETLAAEIVSESEASALQRTELQAAIGLAQAAIVEEQVARVNGDEAAASSLEVLSASIGDPDDPDEDTVYAAIKNEQTARVSGDSAIASSVTSLSSTVGSNTSSISVNASAINGIKAKYAVKVNSAGRISGFELISGAGDSAFAVSADSFYIYSPSTGNKNVFYYDSSTGTLRLRYAVMDGALIDELSVGRIRIAHSQFVSMAHYRNASRYTFSSIGQTVTAAYKSITVEDGYPVTIIFNAMTKVLEGRWNLYLYRDSTCIASVYDWAFGSLQTGATYSFLDQYVSGGSHTYYVKIYLYAADPSAIAGNWLWERNLILLHGKR